MSYEMPSAAVCPKHGAVCLDEFTDDGELIGAYCRVCDDQARWGPP